MAARAKKKGGQMAGLPPFLSYDPQINAERRSLGRGVKDLRRDTRRDTRRNQQDYKTRRQDLATSRDRGLADFASRLQDGLRDLGYRRQDLETDASRGRQDFATQLTSLVHGFDTLGHQQAQIANAAGVRGGSVARAAAAQRASNLKLARQPIDTGSTRLEEDYQRNLGRLTTAEGDLRTDVSRGIQRLGEDVTRDQTLARRDFLRNKRDLGTTLQRGVREGRIGKLDLTQQAIFQARQLRPGAFNRLGQPKKRRK